MKRATSGLALAALLLIPSGNAHWLPQTSGTKSSLRGVSAVNRSVVWASGTGGTFVRTEDGGASWEASQVHGAEALDLRDVEAFSIFDAFLMSSGPGDLSRIYLTHDGGGHWTLVHRNEQEHGFYDAIAFWDKGRGLLLGDPVDGRFFLLRTEDGGKSWQAIDSSGMPPSNPAESAFAARGTCLAVRAGGLAWFGTGGPGGGRVFRSADWGKTWIAVPSTLRHDNPSSGVFSIAFSSEGRGIATGGDYAQPADTRATLSRSRTITAKPGARSPDDPPRGFRSVVAYRSGTRFAFTAGVSGSDVSTDGGNSWTPSGQQGYHAISFAPDGAGWAVGSQGRIAVLTGE